MVGKLLDGKVCVITGSGSGVGKAAALLFAEHGAKLILADVAEDLIAEAVAEVQALGGEAKAIRCDVSQRADVQAAVDLAVATYGRLDVMYNNAGIASPMGEKGKKFFYDNTDEEMDRLFGVNTRGVLLGTQIAIRQFRKQDEGKDKKTGGVVVNTASVAGLFGWGGPLYGATKGAVTNFTRSIANEMAPEQIRINSVCPGAMVTRFGIGAKGAPPQAMLDMMAAFQPMGHIPTAEDSAAGALYLASDLAKNVTGVNLPVDGGMMAGK